MEEKTASCKECGKTYTRRHPRQRYCCEECKKLGIYKTNRASRKRRQEEAKKQSKKKKKSELAIINQRARDAGMTYGKYMAQEYGKQVKVERRK